MKYHYKAQAKTGVIIEDTIEASDKVEVVSRLQKTGAKPLVITEVTKKTWKDYLSGNMLQGSVSLEDKMLLTRNLAQMIKAGLSVSRALGVLKKQSKQTSLEPILDSVLHDVQAGGSLSSGLEKFPKTFSPLFVSLVHAGEETGSLVENLLEIGEHLDKAYKLRKKVKGAMIYPGVIVTAMLIIGVLMFIFVVPTLIETFDSFELDLPATTRAVIFVSNFISENTLLFLGMIVAVIGGFVLLFRAKSLEPFFDKAVLKIPVIGTIFKEMNTALATRTLSSLLKSGLSVQKALKISEQVVQNTQYKATLRLSMKKIEEGGKLSTVFKERLDLYPVMAGEMIEIAEETGNLSEMMKDVALFYEERVDGMTKNLSTIIEPVLMIIVGVAVGFFAVSMMSPMYSLLDSVA